MQNSGRLLAAFVFVAMAGACSSGSDSSSSSSPDPSASKGATLSVGLTDKPMMGSAQTVMVTISTVRVHQSASAGTGDPGWHDMPVTAAMPVDLLKLRGGVIQELCSAQLPAGTYQQVRLQLVPNEGTAPPYRNSVGMMDGTAQPMEVPSDSIKINHAFTATDGGKTELVMDMDADQSCRQRGNGAWYLQPVVTASSHMQ